MPMLSEKEHEYGMNHHTYTFDKPRAMARAAMKTLKDATVSPFTYALSSLVGPGLQGSSTGKPGKKEGGSYESLKLH